MNKICVLGLGYIGLPTASVLAMHNFKVIGVDVNERIVDKVQRGESHIKEPGLRTLVEAAVKSGNLQSKTKPEEADAFIIAVPTPVTQDKIADLSFVKAAAESIETVLQPKNLIVLESTCPPGTTREFLVPILARSGMKIGKEVYVAYCPERVMPGKVLRELVENDRVVGGINYASAEKARELYSTFVDGKIFLTDVTTAEMVKLMENTYRDVNIALANELALICERLGINAWEVLELANKHPRVYLHKPGPGVGGHCLPVDPWFLVDKFPEEAKLIRLSREINDGQPRHVFNFIAEMTHHIQHPKVAVLGLSYKGNIDDTRESPTWDLLRLLKEGGYDIAVYDPYVNNDRVELAQFREALQGADCVVILVDHEEFMCLNPVEMAKLMRTKQIIDTRNILHPEKWQNLGFRVKLLGRGEYNEAGANQ